MATSDLISIGAFFIALMAFIFTWGKYNLSAYGVWLKEINPTPEILITNGKLEFGDYKDVKKGMIKTKAFKISAFIANSGRGNANHPKWAWCLYFKNKKYGYGFRHIYSI